MAECSICLDDGIPDTRITPCCHSVLCTDCGTFQRWIVTHAGTLPSCSGKTCHREIASIAGWDAVFDRDDLDRLQQQIDRMSGGTGGQQQQQNFQPSDADRRRAAWTQGAYVHGCGSAYGISDGCDIVTCPGCRQLVSVTGGQVGAHTFHLRDFFVALRSVSAASPAGALDSLRSDRKSVV